MSDQVDRRKTITRYHGHYRVDALIDPDMKLSYYEISLVKPSGTYRRWSGIIDREGRSTFRWVGNPGIFMPGYFPANRLVRT